MVGFRYRAPESVLLENRNHVVIIKACRSHVDDERLEAVYAKCNGGEHGAFHAVSAACLHYHARRFARIAALLEIYRHFIEKILYFLRRINLPEHFHFFLGKTEHIPICAQVIYIVNKNNPENIIFTEKNSRFFLRVSL